MTKLHINLFGRFSVATERGAFELQTGLGQLLAYLAVAHQPVPRSRAAGTLWPEAPEERARANLSTVIWRLRKMLATQGSRREIIRSSSESIGIDTDLCNVDVEHFRRYSLGPVAPVYSLETLGRAVHALGLYKGDLLEDWDKEWCRPERDSLRQRYVQTLRALAEAFERRGRLDLALRYAGQAAEADPFNELLQRLLIRLLSMVGDKGAAISQFNRFAELARSELGTEPDKETVALLHQVRGSKPASNRGAETHSLNEMLVRPERAPLVGRTNERQRIGTLMDEATTGIGGGVLLLGEAGIGKSRLAEWAMEEWSARGGACARGRCVEFNEPVPYQPLLDALASHIDTEELTGFEREYRTEPSATVLEDLSRVAGTEMSSTWPSGKLRLFNWLRARLDGVTRQRPVLVVIEDLQWADAGTLDFLVYLLERSRSMPVAIIMTSRPTENRTHRLSNTERLSRYCAATLRLGPMSDVETRELVELLLENQTVPSDVASWICIETEGNPLFVVETLRLLQQRGKIALSNGRIALATDSASIQLASSSIPDGVRSAVQQRLALIDPASLKIAEIASVLGRSFAEELLGMLVGAAQNRFSRSLGHLLRTGIFEREHADYRFSHDKIRAVCYEHLPSQLRRNYHARAAAVLAAMPDTSLYQLAWHQSSARQWNLAATTWAKAGDRAQEVYAYEEALRAYRNAISCVHRDATSRSEARDGQEIGLLVKSDEVLSILGKLQERKSVVERIGTLCRRSSQNSLQATWHLRRALLEGHLANFARAARLARTAWFIAHDSGDSQKEAEALRVLASHLSYMGRHGRSLAVSRLALRVIGDTPSPVKASLLRDAAVVHIKMSDYVAAMSSLQLARESLAELGYEEEHPHILITEANALKWSGNVQAARAKVVRAADVVNKTGDLILAARVLLHLTILDTLEGRLGDALRRLRDARVKCCVTGYHRTYIGCLNEVANGVGRLIGNYAWAWSSSSTAYQLARSRGISLLTAICRDSQAMLLYDECRSSEALIAVNEVLQLLDGEHGYSLGPNQESLVRRGAILLALGSPSQAVKDLEAAREIQERTGDRLVLVDTLTFLALAHSKLGEAEKALILSGQALRLLEEIGWANYQPQLIFWHHYLILEEFGREPSLPYLRRAVEFIGAQADTLSRAQARRLRQDVRLNRDILEAWTREQEAASAAPATAELASVTTAPETVGTAQPAAVHYPLPRTP